MNTDTKDVFAQGDHLSVELISNPINNITGLGIDDVCPTILLLLNPGIRPIHGLLVIAGASLKVNQPPRS